MIIIKYGRMFGTCCFFRCMLKRLKLTTLAEIKQHLLLTLCVYLFNWYVGKVSRGAGTGGAEGAAAPPVFFCGQL